VHQTAELCIAGLALVQHLVTWDNVIVFAGVRNPAEAQVLNELAGRQADKLFVLKLVSADESNNRSAAEEIKRIAGRLDVVIANAGVMMNPSRVLESSQENMLHHFTVNVLGPMVLIQATYPLLKASTNTPKFIPISSGSGSIALGTQFPLPRVEYGTSKAALNWLTKKLWIENEGLGGYMHSLMLTSLNIPCVSFAVAVPIHPGMVDTDMTQAAMTDQSMIELLRKMNLKPRAPEESARLVLQQIEKVTRATTGFISEEGAVLPW
jgi:NAD(P)-dependent dehydrogenase (short-subunit alcohol dehydrogenase family)